VNAANFRCLFSTGTSWGVFSQQGKTVELAVHGGKLEFAGLEAGSVIRSFDPPKVVAAGQKFRQTPA
jgi:hypothetical protein